MIQIIPTLFSTTEEAYKQRVAKVESSRHFDNGWVQLDLMDNKFVPNTSIGLDVIKKYPLSYRKEAQLMVIDPGEWIEGLFEIGVDRIIFPVEIDSIKEFLNKIKEKKVSVGLSVNPETNMESLNPYLNDLDAVLFMGVKPGLEGQEFSSATFDKIINLKKKRSDILVGVDGGVKDINAKQLIDAGADYLAIGSFLFNGDIDENVEKIWEAINT